MKCWISVCYPLKHLKTNTIPISPEQFQSIVPLPLNGVCLHVMSVRNMTIFGLGAHFPTRLLLKQYNLEYRPISTLDLHRLTTIPTTLINIHVLSSWSFQIPLVHSPQWSLSEYPNLEQSKAVRQKIHPSLEIFSDWRCTWYTFSFESDHVHFTSPITPKMQCGERFHVSFDAISRPITRVLCIMNSEEIPEYQCSCSFTQNNIKGKTPSHNKLVVNFKSC